MFKIRPCGKIRNRKVKDGIERGEQGWRLGTGDWRLETGNWKLETGNWTAWHGQRGFCHPMIHSFPIFNGRVCREESEARRNSNSNKGKKREFMRETCEPAVESEEKLKMKLKLRLSDNVRRKNRYDDCLQTKAVKSECAQWVNHIFV